MPACGDSQSPSAHFMALVLATEQL